jgi:hypothetical protein
MRCSQERSSDVGWSRAKLGAVEGKTGGLPEVTHFERLSAELERGLNRRVIDVSG